MILGYVGSPNVCFCEKELIIRGRQEGQRQRRRFDNGRGSQKWSNCWKGCRWSLKAGKDKEIDFPQESLEGTPSYQHLDFKSVKSISDY